jgi:ribokinase
MAKIVVIGSSNTDMVVSSPKMPVPGETVMGNEFNIIPGGKGANQAVAAARANGKVTFIAKVGNDDFGRNAIAGYKADKINTDHIFVDPINPTGIAVIIVEETTGQNSIVVASGANGNLLVEEIKGIKEVIIRADIVLMQLEIPLDVVYNALKICKKQNVKTILNPAPATHLSDAMLSLVDIITPNESEIHILTGVNPKGEKDIRKAAAKLLEKVNDSVIVTLGDKGVYFVSKSGEHGFVPTTKVNAVDTTAAGDVFNGYLATAIADGKSYKESISLANKAAAISVTIKGAQPSIPKIEDIISYE